MQFQLSKIIFINDFLLNFQFICKVFYQNILFLSEVIRFIIQQLNQMGSSSLLSLFTFYLIFVIVSF